MCQAGITTQLPGVQAFAQASGGGNQHPRHEDAAHHPLGHTAHQEPLQSGASVGAHDRHLSAHPWDLISDDCRHLMVPRPPHTRRPRLESPGPAGRIGALDLAIVNILGSNLFKVLIGALDDLFLTSGALLSSVNTGSHLVSVLAVLVMNTLLLIGLTYQALKK